MGNNKPKLFGIKPNGDPFSKAWEACEYEVSFEDDTCIFRGDFPDLSKTQLIAYLRRHYPGCKIRDEYRVRDARLARDAELVRKIGSFSL